jgi:arylsulfatase A-like enzyme
LEGQTQDGADSVVVFDEYGPVRMIRTHDWKYVHRFPDGPHELYNLSNDPDERLNRVDDPACAQHVASLSHQLVEWFDKFVDPVLDGHEWGVTGAGQLGRPAKGGVPEKLFATVPIAALKKA